MQDGRASGAADHRDRRLRRLAGGVRPSSGDESTSEGFSCSGLIPGDSINCFAGTGSHADIWSNIEGQIDTSDPFCANLPPHPKPGTKPEPGATALLVVTDATGAESGPFKLTMTPACKVVKPVPKARPAKHKNTKKSSKKGHKG